MSDGTRAVDRKVKLSPVQAQALLRLVELDEATPTTATRCEHGWLTHNGDNPTSYGGTGIVIGEHELDGWFATWRFCKQVGTASVLERLGLVEMEERRVMQWEARLTEAGREFIREATGIGQ